jgi:TIR domain-containing protein/SIR2-like protein
VVQSLGLGNDDALKDPATPSLTEVAARYTELAGDRKNRLDPQYLYTAVFNAVKSKSDLPTPLPLLQLAEIPPLKLFVSTTIDSFMEKALNEKRFNAQDGTAVYTYAPRGGQDLPAELSQLTTPTVFHLMGRACGSPFQFAVTDEDTLEFVRLLQSDLYSPVRLLTELDRNHVLIIGTGFANWLGRFFVRLMQRSRLSETGPANMTTLIADSSMRADPVLHDFLDTFSARTRFFEASPVDFVRDLHEQWMAQPTERLGQTVDVRPTQQNLPKRGAVFISYASQDEPIARAISDALEAARLPVWFDRKELKGGQDWAQKIKDGIKGCVLFAPIISHNIITDEARYFVKEWNEAENAKSMFFKGRPFVVPIVVDDTSPNAKQLAGESILSERQWESLPHGTVTTEFVDHIKALFREVKEFGSEAK